jgi:hypothetical protein
MHHLPDGHGLARTLKLLIAVVFVLAFLGPAAIRVVCALIPAALIVAVVAAALRALWFYTGRW